MMESMSSFNPLVLISPGMEDSALSTMQVVADSSSFKQARLGIVIEARNSRRLNGDGWLRKRCAAVTEIQSVAHTRCRLDIMKMCGPDFFLKEIKHLFEEKTAMSFIMPALAFVWGMDAVRSRGGSCICLLIAGGLTAKRISRWLGDATEGEFLKRLQSENK